MGNTLLPILVSIMVSPAGGSASKAANRVAASVARMPQIAFKGILM